MLTNSSRTRFKIRLDEADEQLLARAVAAIAEDDAKKALHRLADLSPDTRWQEELRRYTDWSQRIETRGRREEWEVDALWIEKNRLNRGLLSLIGQIREDQYENAAYVRRIRVFLRKKYRARLDHKLGERLPVNLRFVDSDLNLDAVSRAVFQRAALGKPAERLSALFGRSRGRLLLLGEAGSGKTSVLLELALELLEWERSTLPVVLDLATWRGRFREIDDWMAEILPSALGVNRKLSQRLLSEFPLLLLLDGFDELTPKQRSPFLAALGRYGAKKGRRYVITSRSEAYRQSGQTAPVRLQVALTPLTPEQIMTELGRLETKDPDAAALRAALALDPTLRSVAATPFFLNTLQFLFAHGLRPPQLGFKRGGDERDRRTKIVSAFVNLNLDIGKNPFPRSREYLHWLIKNLRKEHLTTFELAALQYDWGIRSKRGTNRWGRFTQGMVFILQLLLPFVTLLSVSVPFMLPWPESPMLWIPLRVFSVLAIGVGVSVLVSALIGILLLFYAHHDVFVGYDAGEIRTKDWSVWRWRPMLESLIVAGGMTAIGFGIAYFASFRHDPSADTAGLLVTLSLMFGVFFLMLLFIREDGIGLLRITTPYQRFWVSAKSFHLSIIQHFVLRYQLWRRGVIPFRLVRFMEEMTDRNTLESDGASWRFRHRIIEEYFLGTGQLQREEKGEPR